MYDVNQIGHKKYIQKTMTQDQFLHEAKKFLEKDSIKHNLIPLLEFYLQKNPFSTAFYFPHKILSFQRVTINKRVGGNYRIDDISKLKYPPSKDMVKRYGRLNKINQQVLYGTFDHITALAEMRPDIGDMVTIATWKLKTDKEINITPIFMNTTLNGEVHNYEMLQAKMRYHNYQRTDKKTPEVLKNQIDVFFQFLADCFTKVVNDDNDADYFLSAYFADWLMNVFEDGKSIDAILYPSMRQSGTSTNIAMKPHIFDENFELAELSEGIVKINPTIRLNDFHSLGWMLDGTGLTKDIDGKKINW